MISFDLTEADYLAAQALHTRKNQKLQIFFAVQWLVFLALGTFLALSSTVNRAYATLGWMLIGWTLFAAAATLLMRLMLSPWLIRRNFRQLKMQTATRTCEWTDEHLITQSKYGTATIPWPDFAKAEEDENVFLLYTSKRQFLCFPKRVFSDPQAIDELSHLLRSKVNRGRREGAR